jgi:hypothetical protein
MSDERAPIAPTGESARDYAHRAVRVGLGFIPVLGAVAAEIFDIAISTPAERRRDRWIIDVTEALAELAESQDGLLERLGSDERFTTIVLQASSAAVRTHEEEKLCALRNAVLNAALAPSIHETEQQLFIQLVNDLTAWHLRVLQLFADWRRALSHYECRGSFRRSIVAMEYQEMTAHEHLVHQLTFDLVNRALLQPGVPQPVGVGSYVVHAVPDDRDMYVTTDWGKALLEFIKDPRNESGSNNASISPR